MNSHDSDLFCLPEDLAYQGPGEITYDTPMVVADHLIARTEGEDFLNEVFTEAEQIISKGQQ